MKTITKIISLIILGVAMVGCTIVIPAAAETANNKAASTTETAKPAYQRPTPTTTVETSTTPTRPTHARQGSNEPPYTRPTPTTTVVKEPAYTRPTPTTTVVKDTAGTATTTTEIRSDGRIDNPGGNKNTTKAVSDTTKQEPRRVRR